MPNFSIFRGQHNRATHRRAARREQPQLEHLEGRQLLSTFVVTNTNDSGTGSFRQAIKSSNATTGAATNAIDFQIGTGGTETINLESALPAITHPVVIDGTTQPGTGTAPRIVLNGSCAGNTAVGLTLTACGSTLKGLAIDNFGSDGVDVNSASRDLITDDYIGVTPAGKQAGNSGNGVTISGSSSDNTAGGSIAGAGNLISGNGAHGIELLGANNNFVQGNLIGTNATGSAPLGNGDSGVYLENGADNNLIGGTTAGARNVLSGNDLRGVHISGGSTGDLVEGNFIGTNAAGTAAVANEDSGVLIDGNSRNNTIGGTTAGSGNVLSGNDYRGVHISGGSWGNLVEGNLIGTNAKGTGAVPNDDSGVLIDSGSNDNTIGGAAAGAGNTIWGNGYRGVHISGGSSGNLVEGNLIGTNAAGTATGSNDYSGVLIDGDSNNNTIGGTAVGAGNTISGNLQCGVHISGGSSGNLVEGNSIGTQVAGSGALGNALYGVLIDDGSADNTIGGTGARAGNLVSSNGYGGVALDDAGQGNLIEADIIDSNGSSQPTAGAGVGVLILDTAYTSVIDCTIDSNRDWGILINDGSHTVLTGNTLVNNGLGGIHTT
jgi:parallel beta-helix repeat protein